MSAQMKALFDASGFQKFFQKRVTVNTQIARTPMHLFFISFICFCAFFIFKNYATISQNVVSHVIGILFISAVPAAVLTLLVNEMAYYLIKFISPKFIQELFELHQAKKQFINTELSQYAWQDDIIERFQRFYQFYSLKDRDAKAQQAFAEFKKNCILRDYDAGADNLFEMSLFIEQCLMPTGNGVVAGKGLVRYR